MATMMSRAAGSPFCRRTTLRYSLALVAALVAATVCACSQNGGGNPDGSDSRTDTMSIDGVTADGSRDDGGGGLDATGDAIAAISLSVDPAMTTLRVTDLAVRQMQPFVARARTADGRDVVVAADWSLDRTEVASINASGIALTTNVTGGDVLVTARYGTLTATAMLRVLLDVSITPMGTPPGIEAFFPPGSTPAVDATRTPTWLYPANETVFPQNVYKVLFQWRPLTNDRFRVTFESDRLRLVLYTNGTNTTCTAAGTGLSCFEPTLDVWRFIAGSNPRGTVHITIDGALSTQPPGRYFRSGTLDIGFSRGPVPGAIYYWSTTAAGVRRGTVSDAAPSDFLTPDQTNGACVACHTLSRRGNRLGADVGGNNLWIVEVSPTFPPPRLVTGFMGNNIPCAWNTFSFDETRVISASRGIMTLRRTSDGGPVNTIPLGPMQFGTQPDWSPDGRHVAFALSPTTRDRGVSGARIATIESNAGDTWGAVRMLVGTGVSSDTNMFPSFSWDSQWIAYTHSTSDGQDDVTSDLWLMARDGMSPRALTRANTIINAGVITTATVQDNMPTWAPSGVPDDYAWIAFSSTRDYGGVLSRASRLGEREQIWVAAIDLTRASGTTDPSHPAFRMPFQDLDENTHRPFWAEDRVRPDPDAGVDAGTDATADTSIADAGRADVACVPLHGDCSAGRCCGTNVCWDDGTGRFTCEDTPL